MERNQEKFENKEAINKIKKLKEEDRKICELLQKEEQSINEIYIATGIPLQELYTKLFAMEIEGVIVSKNGKYKVR